MSANVFVTIMFVSIQSGAPVTSRDRAAKPPLTEEGIITAAVRLLQAGGLERMTVRRLAQELDTGPASLYAYFGNMTELHGAMLDRLLAGVDLRPGARAGGWRDRLVGLLVAYAELLFAHPGLARSVMTLRPSGPNYMRLVDSVLALLRTGGVPAGQAAWGMNLLLQLATTMAAEHGTRRESASAYAEEEEEVPWREVSAAEHPGIAWASGQLFSGTGHQRLRWAFDVLITGIAATGITP
jgi:AcrR family transcriptional regulator